MLQILSRKRGVAFALLVTISLLSATAEEKFLTIDEMFSVAEQNNNSIKLFQIASDEFAEGVKVAKNAYTPDIEFAASASYLGDVWTMDRNLSNAERYEIPHLGTNFSVEATQVLYAGGAIKNSVDLAKLRQETTAED